jgi:hypothetical protein
MRSTLAVLPYGNILKKMIPSPIPYPLLFFLFDNLGHFVRTYGNWGDIPSGGQFAHLL